MHFFGLSYFPKDGFLWIKRGFWWQNGLSLDENTCSKAMKLFNDTKHLLLTNISAIGNGVVHFVALFSPVHVEIGRKKDCYVS